MPLTSLRVLQPRYTRVWDTGTGAAALCLGWEGNPALEPWWRIRRLALVTAPQVPFGIAHQHRFSALDELAGRRDVARLLSVQPNW